MRDERTEQRPKPRFWRTIALYAFGLIALAWFGFVAVRWVLERHPRAAVREAMTALEEDGISLELADLGWPVPARPTDDALTRVPEPGDYVPGSEAAREDDILYAHDLGFDWAGRPIPIRLDEEARRVLEREAARHDAALRDVLASDGLLLDVEARCVPNRRRTLELRYGSETLGRLNALRDALEYRLLVALDRDDAGRAWEVVEQMALLTERMRWPALGGHEHFQASARRVADAIVRALALGPPDSQRSERLRRHLTAFEDKEHLERVLRAHLGYALLVSRGFAERDAEGRVLVEARFSSDSRENQIVKLIGVTNRDWFITDRASLIRLHHRLIKSVDLPESAFLAELQAVKDARLGLEQGKNVVSCVLGDEADDRLEAEVRLRAYLRMARMALGEPPLPDPYAEGEGSLLKRQRIRSTDTLFWSPNVVVWFEDGADEGRDTGEALGEEQSVLGVVRYEVRPR